MRGVGYEGYDRGGFSGKRGACCWEGRLVIATIVPGVAPGVSLKNKHWGCGEAWTSIMPMCSCLRLHCFAL